MREEVQGQVVVKLVKIEGKLFIQLLDGSLIRVGDRHTVFGSPTTLGSKLGCDEVTLDPKLIKKNLMMKEVVGRDRSVVANMKIRCMVHAGHVAWHLDGDVGRDLVGLARREHILQERVKSVKKLYPCVPARKPNVTGRRCSDDCWQVACLRTRA